MNHHKGKIGRLPKTLRDEVNRRLENGQKGPVLVAWLNGLPEVQALLAEQFNGQPITKQNLSQWRKHGYHDWQLRREAEAMAGEIGELPIAANSPVTGQVATWASVHYLMAVRKLVENTAPGPARLKMFREMIHDAIALRRDERRHTRLQLQQEWLEHLAKKNFPSKFDLADQSMNP